MSEAAREYRLYGPQEPGEAPIRGPVAKNVEPGAIAACRAFQVGPKLGCRVAPIEGGLVTRNEADGLVLHARTAIPGWLGEPLDVGWAIDVLHPLARSPHRPPVRC